MRLFVLPSDLDNKPAAERAIAAYMEKITDDGNWVEPTAVKTLTLEHRMAAARVGFLDVFAPLYDVASWRTSFLEGTLPVTRFFADQVLPLVHAKRSDDRFAVARIARDLSPLLSQDALRLAEDKKKQLHAVSSAIDALMELWADDADPALLQVLRCVAKSGLLEIPDALQASAFGALEQADAGASAEDEQEDPQTESTLAIEKFLEAPFSQVEPFTDYLSGKAHFDTHQGVKGLEFDRVMVIMDDAEARGFMFKYEDLFSGKGAGNKTAEGTRRLFYVTCSRAKKSLALVAYTSAPDRVREFVLKEGWFNAEEIVVGVPA